MHRHPEEQQPLPNDHHDHGGNDINQYQYPSGDHDDRGDDDDGGGGDEYVRHDDLTNAVFDIGRAASHLVDVAKRDASRHTAGVLNGVADYINDLAARIRRGLDTEAAPVDKVNDEDGS